MKHDEPEHPENLPAPQAARDPDVIEHQALVNVDRPEGEPEQRAFVDKMFGIGFSGWFQLVVICVVAGAIFQAGGIDFFAPNFTFTGFFGSIAAGALNVLGWVLETGWRPFLAGALVVVPVWLAWRLLSYPFRH